MTAPRSISLPARASSAICPGPGRPARSGGLPPWTRVVRMALRSRVPSYSTVTPVCSSNGLTIARKLSCSLPPQVASTETRPPIRSNGAGLVAGAAAAAGEGEGDGAAAAGDGAGEAAAAGEATGLAGAAGLAAAAGLLGAAGLAASVGLAGAAVGWAPPPVQAVRRTSAV